MENEKTLDTRHSTLEGKTGSPETEKAAPVEPAIPDVETLQQELGEARDKYIRLFAEFENVRKRYDRERVELIKYAHEEVIIELLGFYEDFERCVEAAKADPSGGACLLQGVEMVRKRMLELFKKYDVAEIDALGQKFDHTRHEALLAVDSPDHEDGTILEVFQKGYTLGGRVVRTAKVKVAKRDAEDKTLDTGH